MYNIVKVARGHIIEHFNEIFDGLCKLSADPDDAVKNGAQLLDRLLKDIVTEARRYVAWVCMDCVLRFVLGRG